MMTEQNVFDTVVNHLRQQWCKATSTGSDDTSSFSYCRYRTYDGKKCAFGCLIKDEEYSTDFENRDIGWILDRCPTLNDRVAAHFRLLRKLQTVHDACRVDTWEDHFQSIASERNLQYTAP